jgi:hypothetical protein
MKDIFILGFSFILLVSIVNAVVAESAHPEVGWFICGYTIFAIIDR